MKPLPSPLPSRSVMLLFVAAALAAMLSGCGPTADAIHPTLPPPSARPGGPPQTAAASAVIESLAPAPSGSAAPSGIASPLTGFTQGNALEVTDVAATSSGFVAVGFAGAGQGYFGLRQGVVWTSNDGQTWQQTVDPALLDVSPSYVIPIGDAVYLFGDFSTCSEVIDEECTEDPNAGTVVFRSTGGGPWEQLAQSADIIHSSFDGVAAWGNALVAWGAGADDNGTTTIWTSSDGMSWTPVTDIAGLDPVDAVIGNGAGLVAFGAKYDDSIEDTELVAATSSDGTHWTAATAPPLTGAAVIGGATGPGGVTGVGWAESDTDPSLGLTLFSADGTSWSQTTASDGSFDNTLVNDVFSTSTQYVAVGSSVDPEDFTLQTGRVWVSADGTSWRSAGDFGGTFSQYGASTLGPGGLVIFTAYQEDANDEGTDVKSTIYGWFVPNDRLVP